MPKENRNPNAQRGATGADSPVWISRVRILLSFGFWPARVGFWPALEHFENFSVRAGKGQLAQLRQRTPTSVFKRPGRPIGEFDAIDIHRDPVARDRVPHSMEWFNGDGTRAEKMLGELPTLGSAPGQFGIGEFPELGVDHAGRTPANEEATLFLDDEGRKSALS